MEKANQNSEGLIEQYQKEIENCKPFQLTKRKAIQNKISEEQEKMEYRQEYVHSVQMQFGISSQKEMNIIINSHKKKEVIYNKLEDTIQTLKDNEKTNIAAYISKFAKLTAEEKIIYKGDEKNRQMFEDMTKELLMKKYGENYSNIAFNQAKNEIDAQISVNSSKDKEEKMDKINNKKRI